MSTTEPNISVSYICYNGVYQLLNLVVSYSEPKYFVMRDQRAAAFRKICHYTRTLTAFVEAPHVRNAGCRQEGYEPCCACAESPRGILALDTKSGN